MIKISYRCLSNG